MEWRMRVVPALTFWPIRSTSFPQGLTIFVAGRSIRLLSRKILTDTFKEKN